MFGMHKSSAGYKAVELNVLPLFPLCCAHCTMECPTVLRSGTRQEEEVLIVTYELCFISTVLEMKRSTLK